MYNYIAIQVLGNDIASKGIIQTNYKILNVIMYEPTIFTFNSL